MYKTTTKFGVDKTTIRNYIVNGKSYKCHYYFKFLKKNKGGYYIVIVTIK